MSIRIVFSKAYDSELNNYVYYCNGVTIYSSEDLTEPEVRASLEVLT